MGSVGLRFGPEMPTKYEARATEALRALKHRGKIKLSDVAKAANIPESSMSRVYAGRQPVTLSMLDAIERITGDSAIEMLIDPSVELKAVSPHEATLLRYFRSWPLPTRQALISFASFFADEAPVTHDERRAHEQIRRLSDAKKRLVYGYLTFLTEGDLPRDVRIALGLPETDAPQSTHSEPVKK